jgi:4-amino-4-deoxy-L-arabinose transferase-like glycosyltransferase
MNDGAREKGSRRSLVLLLLSAAFLFSANAEYLSLPALDDCFYARKAVEMARRGSFFDVTWNEQPAFQNPPLQIWLMSRCMLLFGESDFAARLPSILMALGLMAVVFRLGQILMDARHGAIAAAGLLLSPLFINNARRAMMEIPLAFWVALALLLFLEGQRRPWLHILIAFPLAGALLTKSLLGLLPLPLMAAGVILCPPLRAAVRRPWIWGGIVLGLGLAGLWPLHQWITLGPHAVRAHFVGEILSRSTAEGSILDGFAAYPQILLRWYQPLILPAAAGVVLLVRRFRASRDERAIVLAVWAVLPPLAYSLSQARSQRYVFAILPALALCAAAWIVARAPGFARLLAGPLPPAIALAAGLVFWLQPSRLTAAGTQPVKEASAALQGRVPAGERVPYSGTRYWVAANPLLYYAERSLAPAVPTRDAVMAACEGAHLLGIDVDRLAELEPLRVRVAPVAAMRDLVFLEVAGCREARRSLAAAASE